MRTYLDSWCDAGEDGVSCRRRSCFVLAKIMCDAGEDVGPRMSLPCENVLKPAGSG